MAADDKPKTTTTPPAQPADQPSERRILPSEYESAASRYGLSGPEAERFVREGNDTPEAADAIKGERVVYRQAYEAVRNAPGSGANVTRRSDLTGEGPDPALPTSGPYGPNVEYNTVDAPLDKDHGRVETTITTEVVG